MTLNDISNKDEYKERVDKAVITYIVRRYMGYDPVGRYTLDGKWAPPLDEIAECCHGILDWDLSDGKNLIPHCKSIKHIATLWDVRIDDMLDTLRKLSWRMVTEL